MYTHTHTHAKKNKLKIKIITVPPVSLVPTEMFPKFQSCMLLTDQIEIHQSQTLVWCSDLLYVMLAGCDWRISIQSVDNMYIVWLTEILETFLRVFCFRNLSITENGGKLKNSVFLPIFRDKWPSIPFCIIYKLAKFFRKKTIPQMKGSFRAVAIVVRGVNELQWAQLNATGNWDWIHALICSFVFTDCFCIH